MKRWYTISSAAAPDLSSAAVLPVLVLAAIVTSVAGLVIGIGRWKAKHGYISRFT